MWPGKLEVAEESFMRDLVGELYELLDLGKLFLRHGQLVEAEGCTISAM